MFILQSIKKYVCFHLTKFPVCFHITRRLSILYLFNENKKGTIYFFLKMYILNLHEMFDEHLRKISWKYTIHQIYIKCFSCKYFKNTLYMCSGYLHVRQSLFTSLSTNEHHRFSRGSTAIGDETSMVTADSGSRQWRRSHDFDVIARLHRRFKHGRGGMRNEGEHLSFGGPVEDSGLVRRDYYHDREAGGLRHSVADSVDLLARQVRENIINFSRITLLLLRNASSAHI